jgi:hypothetical protein
LISEGIDNDKDGMFNEDFSEGVNIDKNFTLTIPFLKKVQEYMWLLTRNQSTS